MAKKTAATSGNVEIRPLEGVTLINGVPRRVRVKHSEILMLKGRQIATIRTKPGAGIGLLGGVILSAAEKKEVEETVAAARGGVKPAYIKEPIDLPFEIIDDEGDDE